MHRRYRLKPPTITACLLLCALLAAGCGSSGEAIQQETSTESVAPPPPPTPTQQQPAARVETRTDTIATMHQPAQESEPAPRAPSGDQGQYQVQVGAFHKAAHATALENVARDRFNLPTTSAYSEKLTVYRVRIGGFHSLREAVGFRNKIKKAYPADFSDAWVVDLRREHE